MNADPKHYGNCERDLYAGDCPCQQTMTEDKARGIGAQHGANAASWVFDGNTPEATYHAIVRVIDEGDPMLYDSYRAPSLSGEFSDDYSERDLVDDMTSDACRAQGHDASDHDDWDDIANAYNDAASESFWQEVESIARRHLS